MISKKCGLVHGTRGSQEVIVRLEGEKMEVVKWYVIVLNTLFGIILLGLSVSAKREKNDAGFVCMILMALTYFAGIAFMLHP